jgi:RNA polymerase sigma-70 factor, ECF subfamily
MHSSNTIRLPGFALRREPAQEANPANPPSSPTSTEELSDECLVARVIDKNRDALAILFRRYSRLVRGIALRILSDASEADDLLQDVFLFVHRKVSVFDPNKASFRSWIVQVTYQRAIDRRRYLHSRHFYTHLDLEGAEEVVDHREGREEDELLSGLVGRATIRALLDTLTADQRDTLTLHFFEGYTFDEIALKLGQSFGNIRNHYYRGLDKLRKQLFPGKLPSRNGYGRK